MDEEEAANVYVGGLPTSVTPDILRAAFIPFGELVDVSIPARQDAPLHYGFVLFEEAEDAEAAIDNMNQNIIHNARIRVRRAHKRSVVVPGRAVWHQADEEAEGTASRRNGAK
jgi:RNA recognition motif-containing protein